ncbi:MAG: carbon-nitrogen hydrolase [Candidatus Bathyarchaeota archaeon]|nr:carbon-nitrogen hydrolase [Candidatus Bathyarchaeota archaeon]
MIREVKSDKIKKVVAIGLIQAVASENIVENMQRTADKVVEAARRGAQIVCLQELYRTRYFPQQERVDVQALAETIPGESTNLFAALAREHKIVVIVPLFERSLNGRFYNSAVVINTDGKLLGTYRKAHIPFDPYFYEKNYFTAGDMGYGVYDTAFARIGVLICYDQWFPEAARINVLQGADILFYPTAIGYVKGYSSEDGDWHDAWKTVQRAHAIANGVHVAAVNRVGEEGELVFWGGSFVCDSFGKVLKEASTTHEDVLVAKVDLSQNKRIQEGWGFLRNRRPDTYHSLIEKERRSQNDEQPK